MYPTPQKPPITGRLFTYRHPRLKRWNSREKISPAFPFIRLEKPQVSMV
jgi:hypothetical protein